MGHPRAKQLNLLRDWLEASNFTTETMLSKHLVFVLIRKNLCKNAAINNIRVKILNLSRLKIGASSSKAMPFNQYQWTGLTTSADHRISVVWKPAGGSFLDLKYVFK